MRARLELLILDVAGDARDVRGLVADALQIGDHFQGRGDRAQVARNGLLLQQELHTQALDLALLMVDLALQRGRLFGALLVRFIFQRVHGGGAPISISFRLSSSSCSSKRMRISQTSP